VRAALGSFRSLRSALRRALGALTFLAWWLSAGLFGTRLLRAFPRWLGSHALVFALAWGRPLRR